MTSPRNPRVRFAPSPTGFLHVGGARTAIFNWLFARHHGGTFVLRIEDTDRQRSSDEMNDAILGGLSWLGIDFDEGPHYQSQAREQHLGHANRLLDEGKAYRCFCTPEALKRAREAAPKGGRDYVYPRTCRDLEGDEADRRSVAGESFALRFRVPDREIAWDDAVHDRTAFAGGLIDDFILLRSDGTPTYMMSVVSDDIAMEISHVIRGDDHISNTPKQILLYEALGSPTPTFAHLPLILGDDRKRLSKRHGAVSVLAYRDQGYLPQATFNFLALLGWSPGDDREKLDREELIRAFDLSGVGKSGAVFDLTKLEWLNGLYLNDSTAEDLVPLLRPGLEAAGLWRAAFDGPDRRELLTTIDLLKSRARTLDDLVERCGPYLDPTDDFEYDAKAEKKHLKGDGLCGHLEALEASLAAAGSWEAEALETALRGVADDRELSAGKLIHPTRLAVTGQGVSPGIFEVLVVLGRERSLRRLRRLIDHVRRRELS
jgi:glutamyl-tRNA synthetase